MINQHTHVPLNEKCLGIPSVAACQHICIQSHRNHVSSLQKSVKHSFRDPENTTNQSKTRRIKAALC